MRRIWTRILRFFVKRPSSISVTERPYEVPWDEASFMAPPSAVAKTPDEITPGAPGWVAPPSDAHAKAAAAKRDRRRPGWGAEVTRWLPPTDEPRPPHR